jgi:hypothetical protein
MGTRRTAIIFALLAFIALTAALLPAVARADWLRADAHVSDPFGTGYVNLLNVQVDAVAENDSTPVTDVLFSDDGDQWSSVPYSGASLPWVLSGEWGAKTLFVRFAGQDGSLSPIVQAAINVDTVPPRTVATNAVHCRRGAAATFRFTVADEASPRVRVELVIVRSGKKTDVTKLGWMDVGAHAVPLRVKLPRGAYTWKVRAMDLAHWAEDQAKPASLVVR